MIDVGASDGPYLKNEQEVVARLLARISEAKVEIVNEKNDNGGRHQWGVYVDDVIYVNGEYLNCHDEELALIDGQFYEIVEKKGGELKGRKTKQKAHDGYSVAYYSSKGQCWMLTTRTRSLDVVVEVAAALHAAISDMNPEIRNDAANYSNALFRD